MTTFILHFHLAELSVGIANNMAPAQSELCLYTLTFTPETVKQEKRCKILCACCSYCSLCTARLPHLSLQVESHIKHYNSALSHSSHICHDLKSMWAGARRMPSSSE